MPGDHRIRVEVGPETGDRIRVGAGPETGKGASGRASGR
jgi:hypothetical protein